MWYYNIGIVLSVFLAFLVLSKKDKKKSDWILSAWLLVSGFHIFLFYIFITDRYALQSFLCGFESPIPLMHGPFLYLYVKSASNFKVKNRHIFWHFIPATIDILDTIQFIFMPEEAKLVAYSSGKKGYTLDASVHSIAVQISGILYVAMSAYLLAIYRRVIKNTLSNVEKIQWNWLAFLVGSLLCIWLAAIYGNDNIVFTLAVVHTVIIAFLGINYVGIHESPAVMKTLEIQLEQNLDKLSVSNLIETSENDETEAKKYEKSSLSKSESEQIHASLQILMEEKKLYINPDLSLTMLANELDTTPNNLSQVINSIEKCNFYDYINRMRIDEFTKNVLLIRQNQHTILTLAYACGYNSKTSFNRNFKNIMQMSPTEYIDSMHLDHLALKGPK